MEQNKTAESKEVLSLDLSELSKKRKVVINGDENKYIELDTTDFSILNRIQDSGSKLKNIAEKYQNISEIKDDEESFNNLSNCIRELDTEMRKIIDDIFDYKVCEVILPTGTMFDIMKNGKFKYEFIIDKISSLYGDDISESIAKMQKNISKKTKKYTK